jgi:hypothetical protein
MAARGGHVCSGGDRADSSSLLDGAAHAVMPSPIEMVKSLNLLIRYPPQAFPEVPPLRVISELNEPLRQFWPSIAICVRNPEATLAGDGSPGLQIVLQALGLADRLGFAVETSRVDHLPPFMAIELRRLGSDELPAAFEHLRSEQLRALLLFRETMYDAACAMKTDGSHWGGQPARRFTGEGELSLDDIWRELLGYHGNRGTMLMCYRCSVPHSLCCHGVRCWANLAGRLTWIAGAGWTIRADSDWGTAIELELPEFPDPGMRIGWKYDAVRGVTSLEMCPFQCLEFVPPMDVIVLSSENVEVDGQFIGNTRLKGGVVHRLTNWHCWLTQAVAARPAD